MNRSTLILASLCFSLATAAETADRTEIVKFKPGEHAATVKGVVKGYDGANYIVGARAGQVVSMLFSPSNRSCYFMVWAPGADTATFDGTVLGNEYTDNLKITGDYKVTVFLMRNAARRNEKCKYSLTMEITG